MIRVSCLLYPGFQLLDVAGPSAIFAIAGDGMNPGYTLETIAAQTGAVASSAGPTINAVAASESQGFDTLLIPGGLGARDPANYRDLLPVIAKAAGEGRRIVCVSSAAFILAEAGLLAGKRAVTHWSAAAELADRFPAVDVDGTALFNHDGNIWTSAGTLAGADLALAIVEQDYGAARAAQLARVLLLSYRRPGEQSQKSVLLNADKPVERFSEVMAWAREHINERLTIDRLADRAALSVRQFTRAFRLATGVSPAKFIEELRIERARALIESGARSLDEVARACGFQSADRLRRAFVRTLGKTPRELRRSHRDHTDAQRRRPEIAET